MYICINNTEYLNFTTMRTTSIDQFKTVCKGSRKIAIEIMKQHGVDNVKISNCGIIGKTVSYYRDGVMLGHLQSWNGIATIIIPTFSPIYTKD